ncbi:MAG: hypothetical protein IPM25_05360 [Chloracidobacterium sp.]|nr:hypothetical protein [Chloracidobacterium sp.]
MSSRIDSLRSRADLVLRFFLLVALVCMLAFYGKAQEAPKAVLIDEYDRGPCDDFLGRLDMFLAGLRANPEWRGFIVIYNPPELRHESVIMAEMMREHFRWRNWDIKPIEIVRGDSGNDRLMQFWRVAPNGSPPKVERPIWSFKVAESVREPFILATETKFGAVMCPEVNERLIFGSYLRENPGARGNIVVRDRNLAGAIRRGNRIVRDLEKNYRINRSRLRIFPALFKRPWNHDEDAVEFWYLP